jgi:hypothetical protein
MKNKKLNIYIFFSILSLAILSSCGGKSAEEIKVSELETACDFTDAMNTCMKEIIAIKGDAESADDLTEEDQKRGLRIVKKVKRITKALSKAGFEKSDLEECPNYEETEEMAEELDGIL